MSIVEEIAKSPPKPMVRRRPRGRRRKKAQIDADMTLSQPPSGYTDEEDVLQNPDLICRILEYYGGDMYRFVLLFDANARRSDKFTQVLARVLYALQKDGNQEYRRRWELLIHCHQQARMMMLKKDAFQHLRKMPRPTQKNDVKTWIAWAQFWTGDLQEYAKTVRRAQATAASKDSGDGDDELKKLLAEVSGGGGSGNGLQKEQQQADKAS